MFSVHSHTILYKGQQETPGSSGASSGGEFDSSQVEDHWTSGIPCQLSILHPLLNVPNSVCPYCPQPAAQSVLVHNMLKITV